MAYIYRLQINKKIIEKINNGHSLVTEKIFFESEDEKKIFINNPEKFVREIGLYTNEMTFNGIKLPDGITLEMLKENPHTIRDDVPVSHESSCQLYWDWHCK